MMKPPGYDNEDIPNGNLGNIVEVSDVQVYEEFFNEQNFTVTYSPFRGTRILTAFPSSVSARIDSGILSLSLKPPSSSELASWPAISENISFLYGDMFNNVRANPPNAKVIDLHIQYNMGVSKFGYLYKGESVVNGNIGKLTDKYVDYFYADKDVTITGEGKTFYPGGDTSFSLTTKNTSIKLKKGWNAVYEVDVITLNLVTEAGSGTITYTVGDPNLKWVYDEYDLSGPILPGRVWGHGRDAQN